jgi:hypothetical protein
MKQQWQKRRGSADSGGGWHRRGWHRRGWQLACVVVVATVGPHCARSAGGATGTTADEEGFGGELEGHARFHLKCNQGPLEHRRRPGGAAPLIVEVSGCGRQASFMRLCPFGCRWIREVDDRAARDFDCDGEQLTVTVEDAFTRLVRGCGQEARYRLNERIFAWAFEPSEAHAGAGEAGSDLTPAELPEAPSPEAPAPAQPLVEPDELVEPGEPGPATSEAPISPMADGPSLSEGEGPALPPASPEGQGDNGADDEISPTLPASPSTPETP